MLIEKDDGRHLKVDSVIVNDWWLLTALEWLFTAFVADNYFVAMSSFLDIWQGFELAFVLSPNTAKHRTEKKTYSDSFCSIKEPSYLICI